MTAPAKCQNCGYSSRYCRQQPDEQPLYVKAINAWVCAACRKLNSWKHSEPDAEATARMELWMAVPPNDGVYGRIPDVVYHADRTSLSSSGARALIPPSCPAIFKALQDDPPKPKPQYDFGHAAHKMVLGEGASLAVLDPAVHGRTKDGAIAQKPAATSMWKEAEAKARKMGKSCITKDQRETAQQMAGKVFAHPLADRLLRAGSAEMSGYWHDDATGIRLRFRPDWLADPGTRGRILCVDYKSAVSANPQQFRKAAAEYGYHCQAAWYLDGLREVEISDDAAFVFIVQQKTPPFLVSVVQLDPEAIEIGRRLNRQAIETFAACKEQNVWPGYGEGIHTVGLPAWAVRQFEAQQEEGKAS